MKILYVSPYPPARDGIGTYTRMLANSVKVAGHDVRVVVPRAAPEQAEEVLGVIRPGSREIQELHAALQAWHPDVVHVQFGVGAFGTGTVTLPRWLDAMRHSLQAPVVITMHEVTRDTALLRASGRALYRGLASRCDRIIVHTDAALDALTGRIGVPAGKAITIPHPEAEPPVMGVTPDTLRARFGLGDARILLAFGFIHVDKGLDDLVRAFGVLLRTPAAQYQDIRLVVAGTVRPRQGLFRIMEARDRLHLARVQQLARGSGVKSHLTLTGYVPDDEIAGWFRAAEAAVLPYRRIEQSGVASLANAFGVPVLASTAGGLGQQYSGTPWMFPSRNPERLAEAIAGFLSAPRDQRAVAPSRGRANDIAVVTAATLDVYAAAASATGVLYAS